MLKVGGLNQLWARIPRWIYSCAWNQFPCINMVHKILSGNRIFFILDLKCKTRFLLNWPIIANHILRGPIPRVLFLNMYAIDAWKWKNWNQYISSLTNNGSQEWFNQNFIQRTSEKNIELYKSSLWVASCTPSLIWHKYVLYVISIYSLFNSNTVQVLYKYLVDKLCISINYVSGCLWILEKNSLNYQ